jgi:lipoteichoic acid synthase
VENKLFNRYLNALHHSDQALGRLLDHLEAQGLADSTLVVVVGDHGEAFGRHNQSGHGSNIYEENMHVPLMFIQPQLFEGEEDFTLGGIKDIGPTIMQILDLPAPAGWQGESLFDKDRHNRVYFFAPWSGFLFGYREDQYKFIYDATNNTTEIYDLAQDPYEITNLAGQLPDRVSAGHLHLAAWGQYHNKFMQTVFEQQPGVSPEILEAQ